MKKVLPVLAVVLIFVLGLGIMLYPAVANYLNAQSQTVAIDQYEEAARANTAYYEGLLEQAQAFNEGVLKRGTLAVMTRGGKGGIQFAAQPQRRWRDGLYRDPEAGSAAFHRTWHG